MLLNQIAYILSTDNIHFKHKQFCLPNREIWGDVFYVCVFRCDGEFVEGLKSYIDSGLDRDATRLHAGRSDMPDLQSLLETAGHGLQRFASSGELACSVFYGLCFRICHVTKDLVSAMFIVSVAVEACL